jgi:23S rRNA (pseudouridine1915-N3)-methyltransferase
VKVTLLAVGKLKEPHWRSAAGEYLKRLGPYASVRVVEVRDRDVESDEARGVEEEGADLLRALPDAAKVVALDAGGRQRTSEELASWFDELTRSGASEVVFAIGGAAGLSAAVRERADESLSLSRMTLPHQMCRVVLLEQIYRAFKILRREPYHR